LADYATILTGGSNNFQTTSEHLNSLATDMLSDGVVGAITNTSGVAPSTGSLACNAQGTPDMTVAVTAGKAYVTATPTSQGSQRLRVNIAAQNATIAANSTGATRYDWIYVSISAANAATPNSSGTNVASIVVSRSTSATTDDGTPPTYGLLLAKVTVANGASSISNSSIADARVIAGFAPGSGSDGWVSFGATLTYASATTFTLTGDWTNIIAKGDKIKLTQTTVKYFYVTSVSYSSSTTVTVNGGSDYTLANASITSPYFSKAVSPVGHPIWFNYTPTITGFSANPANPISKFKLDGTACTVVHRNTALGTSNSGAYTVTAPITSKTISNMHWWGSVNNAVDNSANVTTTGAAELTSNSTTITLTKSAATGGWTTSNGKAADFTIIYEI